MPFSFSRLFLGKKATIVDEDALPYRPREVVPMVVDVGTFKTKFRLTKIGRALKQRLHLQTLAPVPIGHGPLVLTNNEPFSPFSRRLQSPATTSLSSLPHIPDVSSTLGRDFRNATRFALLTAAGEANTQFTNNKIYTTTPCLKRRTRSSSVLGGTDLPRPGTPSDFGGLQLQYDDFERRGLGSPIPTFLVAPVDSPLIWENDQVSGYSSEHHDEPDVLPLGFHGRESSFSLPFVGLAAIEASFPELQRDWCTQQYLKASGDVYTALMPISDPASAPNESLCSLPDLDFGQRKSLSASSVYSLFPVTNNAGTQTSNEVFFSPQKGRPTNYSPIKSGEQNELFPRSVDQSPPAGNSALEAPLYSQADPSLISAARIRPVILSEDAFASGNEDLFRNTEVEAHVSKPEATIEDLNKSFETRRRRDIESIPACTSEHGLEESDAPAKEPSNEHLNDDTTTRTFSTGTVVIHRPRDQAPRFLHESLVLPRLSRHAPKLFLEQVPKHRFNAVADGPPRLVPGFDLFASEEQHRIFEFAKSSHLCRSLTAESTEEGSGTRPEQLALTDPSSPLYDNFNDHLIQEAYQTAIADVPIMADLIKSPSFSSASPQRKQVTFAKVRRIITLAGTIREEYESIRKVTVPCQEQKVSAFADMLPEMQDLKDDWHQDDQDFLHIGEHVAGYEVSPEDIDREYATKDAITCIQSCLASAQSKLVEIESLERALELRHKSYTVAVERVAELAGEVTVLKAREHAGKIVFARMMSDKLVELTSKDEELETLRTMCQNRSVATELAELHEALLDSRQSKLEYLRLAEESFDLLKRADERQAQAEHETQTAKIAQTFAELNQQSAEEYREDMKERILELEAERDEASEGRELALVELMEFQRQHAVYSLQTPELPASTTPIGSPAGSCAYQGYADAHMATGESWDSEFEGEKELREKSESYTEVFEDWIDSQIF